MDFLIEVGLLWIFLIEDGLRNAIIGFECNYWMIEFLMYFSMEYWIFELRGG